MRKRAGALIAVLGLLLVGCEGYNMNEQNPVVGHGQVTSQREACVKRGGEPAVFHNGHGGYTVLCFAPGVLR